MITAIGSAIAGLGALAAIGVPVHDYLPATQGQIAEAAVKSQEIHQEQAGNTKANLLLILNAKLHDMRISADNMRRAGHPVPDWLKKSIWDLEQRIALEMAKG